MHLELAESESNLTVRAEVPGFSAKELEINVQCISLPAFD